MNLLVISHAANRSGAPLSLLAFLRWLNGQPEHQAWFQSLRSGPLETQFTDVAHDANLPELRRASFLETLARRAPALRVPARFLARLQAKTARSHCERHLCENAIDLVLLNSVAAGAALDVLQPLLLKHHIPLAVWVHELSGARLQFSGEWGRIKPAATRFFAASEAVKNDLIAEGLAGEKIEVIYEMVDSGELFTDTRTARQQLRQQLNLDETAFVVGSCGTPEARKGFDLWPEIAGLVPECHFVWLGASEAARSAISGQGAAQPMANRLHVLPPTATPAPFFAGLDVFCLPSRQDPFPLVAIEAALQEVPIVCFLGAGGIPELVGEKAGVVVPAEDVTAMARAIDSLRRDRQFREQLGRNAARQAHAMCDVQRNGPQLLEALERVAAKT